MRAFVLQTFFIPSPSMEHTLNINDRVLVNKLVYDFRAPRRGEIIVFTSPVSWRSSPDETDFIKRVIGVGGDHVACCDSQGRLTVNGTPLDEPYLNTDAGKLPASPNQFSVVVPNGPAVGDGRQPVLLRRLARALPDHRRRGGLDDRRLRRDRPGLRRVLAARPGHWLSVPSTFAHVAAASPG